ncbi:MAG: hypothetical protein KAI17_23330, partial [Thiotrichaceae bacterium]|nr:hypothetical protein [Thiotrichaceae bacterium]
DEGIDLDEAGAGGLHVSLNKVVAVDNLDEAIKLDEEDAGDIIAKLKHVTVEASGDDGIQITELGEGKVQAVLNHVTSNDNVKYGIKIEQFLSEDEDEAVEPEGSIKLIKLELNNNGKGGGEPKLTNIIVK